MVAVAQAARVATVSAARGNFEDFSAAGVAADAKASKLTTGASVPRAKIWLRSRLRRSSNDARADVRRHFPDWVIAGGIDEVNYRKLAPEELRRQWKSAAQAAGRKFILTPGCSVPNDSAPEELGRLPEILGT